MKNRVGHPFRLIISLITDPRLALWPYLRTDFCSASFDQSDYPATASEEAKEASEAWKVLGKGGGR